MLHIESKITSDTVEAIIVTNKDVGYTLIIENERNKIKTTQTSKH